MIKACIFDLDGTLTDTLDSLVFSVGETLKEMGLSETIRGEKLTLQDFATLSDLLTEK